MENKCLFVKEKKCSCQRMNCNNLTIENKNPMDNTEKCKECNKRHYIGMCAKIPNGFQQAHMNAIEEGIRNHDVDIIGSVGV